MHPETKILLIVALAMSTCAHHKRNVPDPRKNMPTPPAALQNSAPAMRTNQIYPTRIHPARIHPARIYPATFRLQENPVPDATVHIFNCLKGECRYDVGLTGNFAAVSYIIIVKSMPDILITINEPVDHIDKIRYFHGKYSYDIYAENGTEIVMVSWHIAHGSTIFGAAIFVVFAVVVALLTNYVQTKDKKSYMKIRIRAMRADPESFNLTQICAICMDELGHSGALSASVQSADVRSAALGAAPEPVSRTGCNHFYHEYCLIEYAKSLSGARLLCPMCRAILI
jgi:hypothetical protein